MTVSVERLSGPSSPEEINTVLDTDGVVIVEDFFDAGLIDRLNAELEPHISAYKNRDVKSLYDDFLGGSTVRLHGIAAKSDSFPEVLTDSRIMGVAGHVLLPHCTDFRLSSAELIEIRGGETAQLIHRDDGSWAAAGTEASPLVVNFMIALSEYTADNGATTVVPGSHRWPLDREPKPEECVAAAIPKGSAAIFRGDTLHGGGKNTSGAPRRGLSVSYCQGWLLPVENSWLGIPLERVRQLPPRAQELLGYEVYDGVEQGGGQINMYEVGSPKVLLEP